ncbi:maltokinase N-terminal cap-like domain-containing protein [Solicola sp. PLA-1-18]|uniref:maltokinase N-terminal cap-like domain-containing protein n=1 Tax=Solicola sp. PLA-1-18 TaxID=3380532 RepID=UPI003B76A0FD
MTAPADLSILTDYLQHQRWFGADSAATVSGVRTLQWLQEPTDGFGVRVALVDVTTPDGPQLYQLPLSYRAERSDTIAHGFVGVATVDAGTFHLYDAVHDPDARAVLLAGFTGGPVPSDLVYTASDDLELTPESTSVLLSVEQSNTSLVVDEALVLKLFRRLNPGRNPDIEVHEALSPEGGDSVAAIRGSLRTRLGDDDAEEYDLAMLQRFLRTATGGWDSARASLRDLVAEPDLEPEEAGGDFGADAERLGLTTRHVHEMLAEHFETREWGAAELGDLADRFGARLDEAVAAAPQLEPFADAVRARYDDVRDLDATVQAQRVHGDLHLGQSLRTTAGWKIIDFEGEPSQAIADRVRLDSPARDVAGMLRSLDYAARSVLVQAGIDAEKLQERASAWVTRNRTCFLDGYGFGDDEAPRRLLAAYELDKAVYEVVYEVRYRPTWVDIPLRAVADLTS